MVLRPISGWAYAGTGDVSPWTSLDARFDSPLESAVGLPAALRNARHRWGLARVACLTAGASWSPKPPSETVGFHYAKLGPEANAGTLRSAWELLQRGAADAVWVRAQGAEFLVERTGEAPVTLHLGARPSSELVLDVEACSIVTAVVVGAAIVDLGLRCAAGGVEPERVSVRTPPAIWQLEVRS
ncbi:MAG: hypothetical protein KUG77_21550 [Nannocystaceae bacterium]|nr:hypothetical protein [Nannocystaceae bacterium]